MRLGFKTLAIGGALMVAALCAYVSIQEAWASTCSLKVWNPGDTLLSSDLNSNFACLNTSVNTLHGSGPNGLIIDQDVAATAAISPRKMAWGISAEASISATCTSSPCSIVGVQRITSITRTGTGQYSVNLAYTAADSSYVVSVSSVSEFTGSNPFRPLINCKAATLGKGTSSFSVVCGQLQVPADAGLTIESVLVDSAFDVLVFDDEAN